jgi:hypothetical protein
MFEAVDAGWLEASRRLVFGYVGCVLWERSGMKEQARMAVLDGELGRGGS